ncbi:MAG: GNAT family N-acetyltransferase [Clostridia bacterium]|nr:GNAT family N-acetyltransferase [Clostridia bacterium]
MKNITLHVPELKDYWYEQKIEADPLTMSYNAGYDVSYYGYHYDTGCIDFPEERWKQVLDKRTKENRYFAYIKDNDINEYVGYVNYQYNKSENRYECGIVVEAKYRGCGYSKLALKLLCDTAKAEGIKELYDNFEIDRENTLNVFKAVGFEVVEEQIWKKFNKKVRGVLVKIQL